MNSLQAVFDQGVEKIFVGGSSNEPKGLLKEISELQLPDNLEFIQFPLPGLNEFDFTSLGPTQKVTTFFMSSVLSKADPARVNYLPMQMRWVFDYLERNTDMCLLQAAYDREGEVRFGPNVDFCDAVLASKAKVIVEINRDFLAPLGSQLVPKDRVDLFVESREPLSLQRAPSVDPDAERIGQLVADLINDGDCIQTGIGAIPSAILAKLKDKNVLGLHGGLIDEGSMALIRNGNVTGERKRIDRGFSVTGMALGESSLYETLINEATVLFRGANYTHEVDTIKELDNFVSINSAIEVDLFGQVNSEFAGGKQLSGTGGAVDFMRAAKTSSGGRSIIAMNATAKGGKKSKIVPKVEMVTALRTDVDIVVTEFGVARIKDLPVKERGRALVEIAAPEFRDELLADPLFD